MRFLTVSALVVLFFVLGGCLGGASGDTDDESVYIPLSNAILVVDLYEPTYMQVDYTDGTNSSLGEMPPGRYGFAPGSDHKPYQGLWLWSYTSLKMNIVKYVVYDETVYLPLLPMDAGKVAKVCDLKCFEPQPVPVHQWIFPLVPLSPELGEPL